MRNQKHGDGFSVTQSQNSSARSFHTSFPACAESTKSEFEECPTAVFNVQDAADFKKRVLESKTPVIVDFHASPCKLLGPRLEAIVSEKKGQVLMAKVDIDTLDDVACEYQVRSVPTVIAMRNGQKVDEFIGLVDDDKIKGVVEKLLH